MTIWEKTFSKRSWGKYPPEALIREVRKLQSLNSRSSSMQNCLELGCGPGANAPFLAENFSAYTAIDISPTAVALAKERLVQSKLVGTFYCGSFSRIPTSAQAFEFIVDNFSIYANNLATIEATLSEVARVLHPSGRFFSRVWGTRTSGLSTGIKIEPNTFDDLQSGPCAGLGVSHFFDYDELIDLYSEYFKILDCNQYLCRDMFGDQLTEEYIITCQSK